MSDQPHFKSKEEILRTAKTANGLRVKDFNVNHRDISLSNKGIIGQIVEEGVFKYPPNSRAEPDFAELGIELKVTGVKKVRGDRYVAKERLVLNIIDYFKEADVIFDESAFWTKNQQLLLMLYYYQAGISPEQFKFIDSILYDYPPEDLKIIRDDWTLINDKIKSGNAHLISEADTTYLAACTKGANGEAVRLQPFSKVLAKQRAFCFKNSYLTHIIEQNFSPKSIEKILSTDEITATTFEMAIENRFKRYYGMSQRELVDKFSIPTSAKSVFELLSARMLGIKGKINKSEEFIKANIIAKTIRVEENGRIIESMSFPKFSFIDLIKEKWADSSLRNYFFETRFMFILFEKENGEYVFKRIKFWNMPTDLLDSKIFDVWRKTKEVLENGRIVKSIIKTANGKTKRITNFPGSSFNGVCHVRPHAINANDSQILPVADVLTGATSFTKQCFWLNNSFIKKILVE